MKNILNFSTKQKGYGRQSLYVDIVLQNGKTIKDVYVQDVFPNVQEHFDFILDQDAFESEDGTYFTNGNGNGEYDRTFETTLEAVQYFVDVDDLDLPNLYVIAWQENTFNIKYHNDSESNGVTIIENATIYESQEEPQNIIEENNWSNCYVTTY